SHTCSKDEQLYKEGGMVPIRLFPSIESLLRWNLTDQIIATQVKDMEVGAIHYGGRNISRERVVTKT
ncbi:hypothetical protein M8C21_008616, partial [Ambrosia artemisiifolia]